MNQPDWTDIIEQILDLIQQDNTNNEQELSLDEIGERVAPIDSHLYTKK